MDCKILQRIKDEFGTLWNCKALGETVKITTPFSSALSELINVYIVQRGNGFVISDGSDLYTSILSQGEDWNHPDIQIAVSHLQMQFEVKVSHRDGSGIPIFYLKVDENEIASAVFNLCNFQAAVLDVFFSKVSVSMDQDGKEENETEIFVSESNGYISETYGKAHHIDILPKAEIYKSFAPTVMIDAKYAIQYVSGYAPKTFSDSVCRAHLLYEALTQSKGLAEVFVAYINDSAKGYRSNISHEFLEISKMNKVNRSQREAMTQVIPV